jgi:Luciferase-like monooxygenase
VTWPFAVAADHADRMVLDLVSPELASEYREKLDALAKPAGRRAPRLAASIPGAVDPDRESYAQRSLVGYLEVAGYDETFAAAGFGEAVEMAHAGADREALLSALPLEAAAMVGLVGDADAIGARLEAYAVGLDEMVLVPAAAGDPGGERNPDGPGRAGLTSGSGLINRRAFGPPGHVRRRCRQASEASSVSLPERALPPRGSGTLTGAPGHPRKGRAGVARRPRQHTPAYSSVAGAVGR